MAHELFLFAHEFHEFTRITKRLDNGDLVGRTNLTNFRASECRAELVRAMPSAAENLKVNFRASECIAERLR